MLTAPAGDLMGNMGPGTACTPGTRMCARRVQEAGQHHPRLLCDWTSSVHTCQHVSVWDRNAFVSTAGQPPSVPSGSELGRGGQPGTWGHRGQESSSRIAV